MCTVRSSGRISSGGGVPGRGVPGLEGCTWSGGCTWSRGRECTWSRGCAWSDTPPCGQTHACKNIPFATSLRTVMIVNRVKPLVSRDVYHDRHQSAEISTNQDNELSTTQHVMNKLFQIGAIYFQKETQKEPI